MYHRRAGGFNRAEKFGAGRMHAECLGLWPKGEEFRDIPTKLPRHDRRATAKPP